MKEKHQNTKNSKKKGYVEVMWLINTVVDLITANFASSCIVLLPSFFINV